MPVKFFTRGPILVKVKHVWIILANMKVVIDTPRFASGFRYKTLQ